MSNKQPNFMPQLTRKRTNSGQVSRRKEINIKAEINEIEIRETIEQINTTKSCFFEKIY